MMRLRTMNVVTVNGCIRIQDPCQLGSSRLYLKIAGHSHRAAAEELMDEFVRPISAQVMEATIARLELELKVDQEYAQIGQGKLHEWLAAHQETYPLPIVGLELKAYASYAQVEIDFLYRGRPFMDAMKEMLEAALQRMDYQFEKNGTGTLVGAMEVIQRTYVYRPNKRRFIPFGEFWLSTICN